MKLPFTDGFYVGDSDAMMNQELINAYVHEVKLANGEIIEQGLFASAGLNSLGATTSSSSNESNRGTGLLAEQPYFVNGTGLFRLNSDETTTIIGGFNTIPDTGPVSIASNDTQQLILVPGRDGFINNGTSVSIISDIDFKANGIPQTVIFIDGYFLCTTDTKKFIISAINDGTAWNPLDFGTAESDPDPIVAGLNFRSQAVIFGTQTTTFFDNIGGVDLPFVRSLTLAKGLFARFSVVEINNTFIFIGGGENENAAIWQFQGNDYIKVSTGAIDKILAALTESELQDIVAYAYSDNNNYFVDWSLPNETISYDITTGKWHLKKSKVNDLIGGWRPRNIIKAYNKLYCGDRLDGTIGEVSRTFLDEYGEIIERTFDVRPLRNETRSFSLPRIEVTVQSGVGVGSSPTIGLSTSKNGSTFGDIRTRSIGNSGNYNKRAVWRRNGRFQRYGLLRFTHADKSEFFVISIDADIVVGR